MQANSATMTTFCLCVIMGPVQDTISVVDAYHYALVCDDFPCLIREATPRSFGKMATEDAQAAHKSCRQIEPATTWPRGTRCDDGRAQKVMVSEWNKVQPAGAIGGWMTPRR
jgi:hypothetical protein